jgi:hypothetical protein
METVIIMLVAVEVHFIIVHNLEVVVKVAQVVVENGLVMANQLQLELKEEMQELLVISMVEMLVLILVLAVVAADGIMVDHMEVQVGLES